MLPTGPGIKGSSPKLNQITGRGEGAWQGGEVQAEGLQGLARRLTFPP